MSKTVGVVLKPGVAEALELWHAARQLAPDARFLAEAAGYHALAERVEGLVPVDTRTFENESDLVLVLGGDGTLIHAASLLQHRLVPILGVNLGHIGFLTEVTREEFPEVFPRALHGELPGSDRMRLDAELLRDSEVVLQRRILNDAALAPQSIARIATYRVTLGEHLVTTLRGDGVIICTPTGSTAYSMAAGGSILSPGLSAIGITPVCPHALTQRPLVVHPDEEIRVTLDSASTVYGTFDGQAGHEFRQGDTLTVRRAAVSTRVLTVPGRSYFKMLRTKLRWGED